MPRTHLSGFARLPQLLGGFHKRLYAKMMFGAVRRKAAVILTPSKFTMNELERLARIPNDRCVVTPLAVNESSLREMRWAPVWRRARPPCGVAVRARRRLTIRQEPANG